jgi:NAD-dependent dihydropyrimidine dehydrogenase PreA subunit
VRGEGIFIAVEVGEEAVADPALAAKLAEACPVDIFESVDGRLSIVERNLDECVLCKLCMHAAPGAVKVLKLYDDGAVLA